MTDWPPPAGAPPYGNPGSHPPADLPPPDPATLVRAVLDRAGVASSSSSEVVPYPKLEPLGAEQVQLVERIGEHVEYLSRTDEGEMAEAFLGVD